MQQEPDLIEKKNSTEFVEEIKKSKLEPEESTSQFNSCDGFNFINENSQEFKNIKWVYQKFFHSKNKILDFTCDDFFYARLFDKNKLDFVKKMFSILSLNSMKSFIHFSSFAFLLMFIFMWFLGDADVSEVFKNLVTLNIQSEISILAIFLSSMMFLSEQIIQISNLLSRFCNIYVVKRNKDYEAMNNYVNHLQNGHSLELDDDIFKSIPGDNKFN